MKRSYAYGFILFPLFAFWITVATGDTNRAVKVIDDLKHGRGKVGTYRALIIGINDYKDPKIPDLKTPLNDTRALADLLQSKYGFTVETINEKKATRKQIYSGAVVEAPGKTAITLEANVPGAKVFVDGRPVGTTPLKDFSLSPGEHILTVDQHRLVLPVGRSRLVRTRLPRQQPRFPACPFPRTIIFSP
jgi:hypothetical protein